MPDVSIASYPGADDDLSAAIAGDCGPHMNTGTEETTPTGIPLTAHQATSVPTTDPSHQITENQRRWSELHGSKSIGSSSAEEDLGTLSPISTMQASRAPPVARVKAAVLTTPPTAVTLKPRLKSTVVNELD